jgi:hypothetical protein
LRAMHRSHGRNLRVSSNRPGPCTIERGPCVRSRLLNLAH